MNSIIARQMLGGDFYVISYDNEIPTVATVRRQLYDVYVGENGRNEMVTLFDVSGNPITDSDMFVIDKEKNEDEKGDTISISMFVDREKKMKKEENEMVEDSLRSFMNARRDVDVENRAVDFFEEFRMAIISTKALVAGGSILSSFGGFSINDLDIYVNYSHGLELLTSLAAIGFKMRPYSSCHHASQYDGSFFRKNNIQTRFYIDRRFHYAAHNERRTQSIDVMIIPDGYDVVNVVTNFDLTFCEIWWNGVNTFASDPYGVRNKCGILKPDYRKSLFTEFNSFIINRLQKYQKRGFVIDTCLADFCRDHPNTGVFSQKEKTRELPNDHKKWAMYHVRNVIENELSLFVQPMDRQPTFLRHRIYFKLSNDNLEEQLADNREEVLRFVYFNKIIYMSLSYQAIFKEVFNDCTFNEDRDITHDHITNYLCRVMENDLTPEQCRMLTDEYNRVIESIRAQQQAHPYINYLERFELPNVD